MAWVELLAAFASLFLILSWFIATKRSTVNEWPVLGVLPGLLLNGSRLHDFFTDILKLHRYTYVVKGPMFSNMSFLATSDPENIHYISSTKFNNFNKGPDFKEIFEVLGDGIFTAESDSWKMQRKLTHSIFRHSSFLKLVDTISQQKIEMGLFRILDHASGHGLEVDMQDLFQRFTSDVTCTFLLGYDLNSLSVDLPEVPFAKAVDVIGEVLLHRHLKPKRLWKLQKWLQVGLEKKATNARKIIDSFIYQQISHMQKHMNKNTQKGEADEECFNIISALSTNDVLTKCKTMQKSVETFLRDYVMSILSAGRDTTATALTWLIWLVFTHPQVQSKIREEIQATFQIKPEDPWRFPSYQKLNELIYLHATICETLRLYPPVPFNHKASIEPDILPSGHRVKKETELIISIYATGRMEEIWGADYCDFRPERWISEKNTFLDVPSFKFNVFGAGARGCVGKDLAFREIKAVAAAVIWSYNIRVITDHPVVPKNSVILHMQHGLKVNVAEKCMF